MIQTRNKLKDHTFAVQLVEKALKPQASDAQVLNV